MPGIAFAQTPTAHKTENVIVVMLDGMRWEEVFRGADPALIKTMGPEGLDAAKERSAAAQERYWRPTAEERRKALMPFLWSRVASDGEAGLAAAKSFEPNLIILDLLLPKKSGFEVLETLKANQSLSTTPVIVMSNLGEDTDIKRALSLGAVDYYVKSEHPINEIVEKIRHVLIESK